MRPVEIAISAVMGPTIKGPLHFRLLKSIDDKAPEGVENQMLEAPKQGGVMHQAVMNPEVPIKQMKLCAVAAESEEGLTKKIEIITARWGDYTDSGCVTVLFDDSLVTPQVTPSENAPAEMSHPKEYPVPATEPAKK